MTRRNTLAELTRIHAVEAGSWTERISRALAQIALALDPHAQHTGTGANGTADPTATAAINELEHDRPTLTDHARHDRRELNHAIIGIDRLSRAVSRILDEWAPVDIVWCSNHLRWGYRETRSQRSQHCRWCADINRRYGQPPTLALIRRHDRGQHITDGDYRKALHPEPATDTPHRRVG